MVKKIVKTNPAITLLSGLCNFRLPGVPNNPSDSIRLLNIDKGIAFVKTSYRLYSYTFFANNEHETEIHIFQHETRIHSICVSAPKLKVRFSLTECETSVQP